MAPTSLRPKLGTPAKPARSQWVGWQGLRFVTPPEWSITGFSREEDGGYLKVDSPGTVFAQFRWMEAHHRPAPRTLAGHTLRWLRRRFGRAPAMRQGPDLHATLTQFLDDVKRREKQHRTRFESRLKPEVQEAGGERTAINFSWTGTGRGQGKIWRCSTCGRTVIAQVVGQLGDSIQDQAATIMGSIQDHGTDGWNLWALYDLFAEVPTDVRLIEQSLMSGYLKLVFRGDNEYLKLERWGLADITLKKFTLLDWIKTTGMIRSGLVAGEPGGGHVTVGGSVTVKGARALLGAGKYVGWRPWLRAHLQSVAWHCPESNRIYAVHRWARTAELERMAEIEDRLKCH